MKPCLFLFLFLSAFLCSVASVEGQQSLEDEIVVTATALEEDPETVPASVTLITREEIESMAALDVGDVLRRVPGVAIARAGTDGKQASLFTRGTNSTQTLVLWNGVEINDPYFSGYDWGRFSTLAVERIEVVRGPYSALWGADAVGGVIHVITSRAEPSTRINVAAGRGGLLNLAAGSGFALGSTSLEIFAERREDDGFFVNDDFEQTALNLAVHNALSSGKSIGLTARLNDYDLGLPFNLGVASPERRQSGDESQLVVPFEWTTPGAQITVHGARVEHDLHFEDPDGAFGPETSDTRSVTYRLTAQVTVPTRVGTFVGGGEVEQAEVDDVGFGAVNLDGEERDATGLFAEYRTFRELSAGRVDLVVGARRDDYEEFGAETSPRISIGFQHGANRWFGSWGEAYRAPSVGDLYYPFFGNPGLKAETTEGYELGFARRFARGRVGLTWFENDLENLIVYDPTTFRAENIGQARTRGIEIQGEARWRSIGVQGSMSLLDAEDRATGQPLARRADETISAGVSWNGARLDALLSVLYVGERPDVEPTFPFGTITTDSYATADLAVSYALSSRFEPWIRVTNLLDEDYEEVAGFPAPGTRWIVGVRYSR